MKTMYVMCCCVVCIILACCTKEGQNYTQKGSIH